MAKKKQTAEEFARDTYGYLAAFLSHKEIGPLLRKAAKEKYDMARLQGALYKTRWWKKTSAPMREWQALEKTDRAEANNRIQDKTLQIRMLASQMGVDIEQFNEKAFAKDALRLGMSNEEIMAGLASKIKYDPKANYQGDVSKAYTAVKKAADQYMVSISDESAFGFAKKAVTGTADEDNFESRMKELAKSRYTWLAKDIDAGYTVRELAGAQIKTASDLLEKSETGLDFMNNPKFSKILDYADPQSGERRMMTLGETQQYVRSLDDWGQTRNGQAAIAQGLTNLTSFFGKRGV